MYDLKHLFGIAQSGFAEMLPAVRMAFNDNRTDDKLDRVFGAKPRHRIIVLTIIGILIGEIAARLFPEFVAGNYLLNNYINWSAVFIGMAFALLIRRYLFTSTEATSEDFPWLAASLIPAAVAIAVIAFTKQLFNGSLDIIEGAPLWTGVSAVLLALVNAIGVVAALTIAVAALCFRSDWPKALMDLSVQLLVFKILIWVTVLVIVDIGFVGPILASIIESVFSIQFPDWLADFIDQLTLAGLLLIAYGAVIGAVWTVCQKSFGTLLEEGEVNILKALKSLTKKPKKTKKQKESKGK